MGSNRKSDQCQSVLEIDLVHIDLVCGHQVHTTWFERKAHERSSICWVATVAAVHRAVGTAAHGIAAATHGIAAASSAHAQALTAAALQNHAADTNKAKKQYHGSGELK